MRLLLDTHTLLWFALTDPQLSGTAISLIIDPDNEKLVSPASYWEIAIKISIKKYAGLEKPDQHQCPSVLVVCGAIERQNSPPWRGRRGED